jgi:hypothetical protein
MEMNLFPPEFTKHGLAWDWQDVGKSITDLVSKVWELDAAIQAAKVSTDASVKVANHPYDVKAAKDQAAAKVAADLVKAFTTACTVAIDKNRNVAYHLSNIDPSPSAWFTTEVQYFRLKTSPGKPATSGSKLDDLRSDRKVLTQSARNLLETMPILSTVPGLPMESPGKVKLPNLQGAGVRSADTPTGRHAKYRQTIWSVDDVTFPIGTDLRDIVRAIWSGPDRVGKKAADLINPIDAERKKVADKNATITVELNGKTVTYKEVTEESAAS